MLHELSLGDRFESLHVEVYSVDGVVPGSKPKDPVFIATVRDPSGYCVLAYRDNIACTLRKGKFYVVSGAQACACGCEGACA